MNHLNTVRDLIALAFGVGGDDISVDTVQADVPAWDSVGHLNLMLMLEDNFKIALQVEDMVKLTSVKAILEFLAAARPSG